MKKNENRIGQIFNAALIVLIAVAAAYLLKQTSKVPIELPTLGGGAGLGLVFLFGLLTSIHCVGMCGGLALSQSVKRGEEGAEKRRREIVLPPALFNFGRMISYTIVGAFVGGIGQALSLSVFMKGLIPIIGGGFIILMALNTLGAFPFLRRLQVGAPQSLVKKIRTSGKGPFVLGVLMGLMPCGPLQMAEMYALTTGSAVRGALAMLAFSAGTVPCLFILGCFGSFMTKRFSKAVVQCSATVVIALGVLMVSKGLAVEGISNPLSPSMSSAPAATTTTTCDSCDNDM